MSLQKRLMSITERLGYKFTFKDQHISFQEIFSDTGLLPGLTKRADQLASLCLGYGLGASFEDTEQSLLGSKVSYDDFTPEVLRLLCITDVLYEIIKSNGGGPIIPLDELMYD
jgi:intracellular multiplication protein IcmS